MSETAIVAGSYIPYDPDLPVYLITRSKVKGTFGLPRGNDTSVNAYLAYRFAPGIGNHGKGTKKAPGFFYGVTGDAWAAIALGIAYIDLTERNTKADQKYLKEGRIQ